MNNEEQLANLAKRIQQAEKQLNQINERKAPLDWVCRQLGIDVEEARQNIEGRLE